jgi:predicted metal-dependent enzyme (double-stranded beta helix superfamily)
MDRISDENGRMAYFQRRLPELLMDRSALRPVLENMAVGRPWPNLRDPGLFANEILLYLDPGRRFSLRAYFHPPEEHTIIHDHTAWGVSGTPFGRLSIIAYNLAESKRPNRVRLEKTRCALLSPGEVDLTLPGDPGLHQTGNPDHATNIMISVYGRPGRRLYINTYLSVSGPLHRLYPPKILRRMLARQVMERLPL